MNVHTFAKWLDAERNKKDWSRAALARAMHTSGSHLSYVLSGQRSLTADFCILAANALDADPVIALQQAGKLKRAGFPTVGDSAPGLTPHEAAMLRDYRRLSAEMRVRAAKIIEDLL